MKLRYLLSALLATCALLAGAQSVSDPMYMVLNMRNGQHKAVNIADVNRLTFPSGTMKVEKKDASTESYVLTEIYNLEFSKTETGGIQSAAIAKSDIAYNRASSTIHFEGAKGQEFAIYGVNGALMLRFATADGAQTLDVSELASGTYIVAYKGQTLKFVK